ncbi:MAG: hypothetical protein GY913_35235 [Proteobacteria bacterium]|nr:hypothetical protein [Pseudomonadota bacterium]
MLLLALASYTFENGTLDSTRTLEQGGWIGGTRCTARTPRDLARWWWSCTAAAPR